MQNSIIPGLDLAVVSNATVTWLDYEYIVIGYKVLSLLARDTHGPLCPINVQPHSQLCQVYSYCLFCVSSAVTWTALKQ